jgi:hypothetical protein
MGLMVVDVFKYFEQDTANVFPDPAQVGAYAFYVFA